MLENNKIIYRFEGIGAGGKDHYGEGVLFKQ